MKQDLTKKETQKGIKKKGGKIKKISPDMCIFSIGVMENGKLVDIYGVEMLVQEDIMEHFYGKPFLGKPKLFLLQFCRGVNIDFGVVCYTVHRNDGEK